MANETILALAGLVKTAAGAASQFSAASEYGSAANDLTDLSQDEARTILETGQSTSRAFRQRGNAALQDVATLNALTESHIRALAREERRATGLIAAQAAGSGVELSGSPLLAQLTASTEIGYAAANQNLRRLYGTRRLQFEVEQSMQKADDVLSQAQEEADATLRLRASQAATLRRRQMRTILGGVETLTSPTLAKNLDTLFPSKPQPGE